jgi:hypothetical protein
MDQRTYDAAQQGLLSLAGIDHEARLREFLDGLRSAPEWTAKQVADVEHKIRELLGMIQAAD